MLALASFAFALDLPAEPLGVALPGLPNAPLADRDGVIWIPTDAGLVRLDGDDVRVFGLADGMPDASANVAWQDLDGHLWVGTETGLVWVDRDRAVQVPGVPGPVFHVGPGPGGRAVVTVQRISYAAELGVRDGVPFADPLRMPAGTSGREVWFTADGRALMGTDSSGLMEVEEGVASPVPDTGGTKAGPFAPHPSGALFFGTGMGVARSDGGGIVRWLDDRYITGTAWLGDALYVGTSIGELWRIDDALGEGTATRIGQGPPISLYELQVAGGGLVFGATWGGGLVRHDPRDGSFDVFPAGQGVSSSIVRGLSVDADGTLWVATEGGVDVLWAFATDRYGKEELGSDEVLVLHPTASGALAVGTPAGLAVKRAGWTRRTRADGLASVSVEGLAEIEPDLLLVTGSAHGEGVSRARIAGEGDVRVEPVLDAWGVGYSRWGAMVVDLPVGWLVERHRGGVMFEVAPDGRMVGEAALPEGAVLHHGQSVGGATWLGTSRGLFRWDQGFVPWEGTVRHPDIAGVSGVGGAVWIRYTQPIGADRLDPDGRITNFDRSSGLPDDRVAWVAGDGPATWIGTRAGVARLEADRVTRVLSSADGFRRPTTEGTVFEGRLWTGGSDGLRAFSPWREASERPPLSPVVRATLGGRPADGPVDWSRRELIARLDARTHVDRAELRFRWRLLPYGSWSEWSTDRWVRGVLASGAHRLEVEVRSGDGRTGRAEVPIEVRPPWWRSGPAMFAWVALVFATGAAIGLRRASGAERERRRLTSLVDARTAELRELAARLESASNAKSRYLADMSHELRTPLNAIIGYTELLAEEARESGADDLLPDMARVEVAARHLLALISDVLDLSKIEAGRLELVLADVDLAELVRELATTLELVVTRGGNQLVLELLGPAVARADAHRVRQILTNLIGNAAKFTSGGEVRIRLRSEGAVLAVDVVDSGQGMSAELMERLFRPFAQGSAQTAAAHGGTGLGLVISRELARLMGGDIDVVSEPGLGSTFTLRLPAAQAAS